MEKSMTLKLPEKEALRASPRQAPSARCPCSARSGGLRALGGPGSMTATPLAQLLCPAPLESCRAFPEPELKCNAVAQGAKTRCAKGSTTKIQVSQVVIRPSSWHQK